MNAATVSTDVYLPVIAYICILCGSAGLLWEWGFLGSSRLSLVFGVLFAPVFLPVAAALVLAGAPLAAAARKLEQALRRS